MTPAQGAPPAADYSVELPVGLLDPSGRLHRTAALRKMRGYEEDLLYDTRLDGGRLITALLSACVVRVGDVSPVTAELIAELTSADRDYLLVELRRISLGSRLDGQHTCPACRAPLRVVDDLGALPVRRLPADALPYSVDLELEDGYTDREGTTHRTVTLRLPTGHDESFVARTAERDPIRARDALLLRCITAFGDLGPAQLEGFGGQVLRSLSLADRRTLWQAFVHDRPGVDFHRRIDCPQCGHRFRAVMDAADFFGQG